MTRVGVFIVVAAYCVACRPHQENTSAGKDISDIEVMNKDHTTNTFTVICKKRGAVPPGEDLYTETGVTAEQIQNNQVCMNGSQLLCSYDGDKFVISNAQGQNFVKNVDNDTPATVAKLACNELVAGMYDGDELIVFDATTSTFKTRDIDNEVVKTLLQVKGNLLAFYDLDEFFVFDVTAGTFYVSNAGTGSKPILSMSSKLVAFYDGNDFQVYDSQTHSMFFANSDPFVDAMLVSDEKAALLYDGDDVYGYCGGQMQQVGANNNVTNGTKNSQWNAFMSFHIGGEAFTLQVSNCNLSKTAI